MVVSPVPTTGQKKGDETMISIVLNGSTQAKFEKFEKGKAMDWLTQQGWYVTNKVFMDGNTIWVVEPLP